MTIVRAGTRAFGERRERVTPARMVRVRVRGRARTIRWVERGIGITGIWRATFAVLCDNAPSILLLSLVGFAGPAIICILFSVLLRLDFYGQVSGPLATWLGIGTLQGGPFNPVSVLVTLQAGLGAIGLAFARGVITHIALSDEADSPSLAATCRAARARFSGLFIGSLVYGAVVMAGAVGVNAMLHNTDFDLSFVGQPANTTSSHVRVLALRTLDAFVPSPGSPFSEFMPMLRQTAFESFTQAISTGVQGLEGYGIDKVNVKIRPDLQSLIVVTSVALLILAEALLRFTPVIAMRSGEQGRLPAIAPVWRSICFGLRHFGAVTIHVWLLRLLFVAAYSIFFMLPVVLVQDAAPPVVRSVTSSLAGHWSLTLTLVCYWLVMALFMAFCTVYDARLVLALAGKANLRHAGFPAAASAPLLVGGCQSISTQPAPAPIEAAALTYAVQVYREHNCSGCHQLDAVGPEPRPGPTHNGMRADAADGQASEGGCDGRLRNR